MRRFRERPLVVFLPLQAFIYFWNLRLLSPWYDEADQLIFLRGTLSHAIDVPAGGGHPPLYFALIYYWMRLPLGLDWTTQARAFSVIFALCATWAADRLWARTLPAAWRWTFLGLWTFSPFLLLYSRMGRSYSFQLLVGTAAGGLLVSWLAGKRPCPTKGLAFWLAVGVYVHAIPGFALLGTTNLALLWKRRIREVAIIDAVVGLAYLPWLYRLLSFLPTWGKRGGNLYALTGSSLAEIPVKVAYWAFSFTMGEAVPDTVLVCGAVVGVGVAVLLVRGTRRRPELLWLAVPAASVGFAGVARWVSYPFIPARMVFLFPVFLMALVAGAASSRRLGPIVMAGMALLSISGIWSYFHLEGFRNKQYPMPVAQIADRIRGESPGRFAVLVDDTNADAVGLQYQLSPPLVTSNPATPAELDRLLRDPQIRTFWFLRSAHDISPAQSDRRFEAQLAPGMRETVYPIEPLTPLELWVARAAGIHNPPRYFQELLKFERISP